MRSALVVMGMISTWVGLIDRRGARVVMSVGTVVLSGELLACREFTIRSPTWRYIGRADAVRRTVEHHIPAVLAKFGQAL